MADREESDRYQILTIPQEMQSVFAFIAGKPSKSQTPQKAQVNALDLGMKIALT